MIEKRTDITYTAKRATRIVSLAYVLIKLPLYMLTSEPALWPYRIVACAIILAAAFGITGSNLSNRGLSILAPLAMGLTEILWCVVLWQGEWLIYFSLIGCSLLSLLYLDSVGLFVTMAVSALATAICSFVLKIDMTGIVHPYNADIFGFMALLITDFLIFFICKYSVGVFRRFLDTGQAFDMFMETTPSFMVVVNDQARVHSISRSLADWLGISHWMYAVGRPFLDLFKSGEMKMVIQEVMETGQNVEKTFELTLDGKKYWFLLRSALMGDGGIARTFLFSDITLIMEAKNAAEYSTRAKSSFLANMSHEIRTPMNAIVGMTELIMTRPLDQEQMAHAAGIKSASMSLLGIINDILDFSKIDAEKMEIIVKPFDFLSFINDTINMINIKMESSNAAFTVYIPKDIPPRINGDELRIKQALINLLNNAIKFTSDGCVSLKIACRHTENGLTLGFTVTDTGIGIRKEDIGKLFVAFSQLDTRRNRNIIGTGLGLAITQRLVTMMGGDISVESTYGKGSVFSFNVAVTGRHSGSLISLKSPELYSALCFEPNKYHADALESMLSDLGVANDICLNPGDFAKKLETGLYTHVFFDKSALPVIERLSMPADNPRLTLIRDIRDTNLITTLDSLSRPILITSLAMILRGEAGADSVIAHMDDVSLGAFYTSGARALVIDDNPVNLNVADGMLRHYGIDVITALNGMDGFERVQAEEFDIVFIDHMMPVMDGVDTTKAIRRLGGRYERIPLVALTANAISGVEDAFTGAGANGFLSKPIVIRQLHRILLQYLPPEKIIAADESHI